MKLTFSVMCGLFLISIINGCSFNRIVNRSDCIPPNVTNGYELTLLRRDETTVPRRKSMPSWWKSQLNKSEKGNLIQKSVNDIVVQNGNTIWMAFFADAEGSSIIRYNSDTREMKKYAFLDQDGKGFVADDLLFMKDNTLWVRFTMLSSKSDYSILAKYDTQKDSFDIITDIEGLLKPTIKEGFHSTLLGNTVLESTPDGVIIVVIDGMIYSYDPVTNKANRFVKQMEGLNVYSITVSRNGHIWFITREDSDIRELDLISGSVWNYGSPPGIDPNNPDDRLTTMNIPMMSDDTGKIWVADYGWLEPTNNETRYIWHQVIRSTIFISIYDPEYLYKWKRPEAIYQFSDNNIWFSSKLGVINFNVETNQWCWKSTD